MFYSFSQGCSLELDLWGKIVPEQSSFRVASVKVCFATSPRVSQCQQVEIKMKKQSAIRWLSLEGDGTGGSGPAVVMATPDAIVKKTEKNWDKVTAEAIAAQGEDKPTGEAALNEFFKDLYARSMWIRCITRPLTHACQVTRTRGGP